MKVTVTTEVSGNEGDAKDERKKPKKVSMEGRKNDVS